MTDKSPKHGASEWADVALAACLDQLRFAEFGFGPKLHVLGAWTVGAGTICIVYRAPYSPLLLGLTRSVDSEFVLWFDADADGRPDPAQFGKSVADYDLSEPLGTYESRLAPDKQGVHWWGDPNFS